MIGKIISHYKILEKLGEGGMGDVYKAEDIKLKRTVALKFLPLELTRDEDTKKRFIHEAQAASSLQHHNIYTIHEIDETDEGQLFIVMDCYEGKTIEEKIKQSPLGIDEVLDITIQMAQGLDKAHQKKIIHRDIKSANIIVTNEGITKIVDFGIAKLAGQTQVTKDGTSLGTASYMSPEQTLGKNVDHRTDIWSLGVVLYEMLTGLTPFQGDYEQAVVYSIMNEEQKPLTGLRTGIPKELERIVNKTLAKNPNERYQRLDELIVDLKHVKKEPEKGKTDVQVPPIPIIAVLPFTNMSADKDQDYFCDGIAEDILNDLTHLEGLHVVARSSSFALKNKHQDVRRTGLNLGADTLVEGSVRKAGNRLRITAQLINVSDGMHLWSERYDRDLEDVFAIQDEIAKNIVGALEIKLSKREKHVLGKAKTKDILAYDYYLKGREFYHKGRRKNIEYASEMFSRAIEEDPNYALAYAGLANCYSDQFMFFDGSQENLERSGSASKKALELDQNLAEAHTARGLAVSLNKQYVNAEKEFDRAIGLNPKLYEAYYFYARTCRQQGNFEKAVSLFEKASEVRPEDYRAPMFAASAYKDLGISDKANEAVQRSIVLVEKHLQLNPDDARALCLGGGALSEIGEIEKALDWAKRAIDIDPNDPGVLYNASCIYSLLEKIDQALNCFERAIDSGFASKEWIETDSDLDKIRNQPRFKEILAKLN
jgi:serine/threonine protein kinase/Flp pilus assembly protein TadD